MSTSSTVRSPRSRSLPLATTSALESRQRAVRTSMDRGRPTPSFGSTATSIRTGLSRCISSLPSRAARPWKGACGGRWIWERPIGLTTRLSIGKRPANASLTSAWGPTTPARGTPFSLPTGPRPCPATSTLNRGFLKRSGPMPARNTSGTTAICSIRARCGTSSGWLCTTWAGAPIPWSYRCSLRATQPKSSFNRIFWT